MKRKRTGTMIYPHVIKKCDENLNKANVKSRNDFIEKAILFYADYLNSNKQLNYLNEALDSKIDSKINNTEYEINKNLYKLAVEVNVMSQILANYFEIDDETLTSIREKAEGDVLKSIGTIEDIFKILERSKSCQE